MGVIFQILFMGALMLIAATLISFILVKLFQGLFGSRVACVLAGILIIIIIITFNSSKADKSTKIEIWIELITMSGGKLEQIMHIRPTETVSDFHHSAVAFIQAARRLIEPTKAIAIAARTPALG